MANVLSVEEARAIVRDAAHPLAACRVPLTEIRSGSVLADSVLADRDSPPFAKSLRDGFAVRSEDVAAGCVEWQVVGEVFAGSAYSGTVGRGEAVAIATGAPIPHGADSVVMLEQSQRQGNRVILMDSRFTARQHVFPQGAEFHAGEAILQAGDLLNPVGMAMLAAVGQAEVAVIPRPRVAILPTGDELRDVHEPLDDKSIRNTNGPLLAGLVQQARGIAQLHARLRDDRDVLISALERALNESDIVVLTGGVSVGPRDLVPDVIQACGGTIAFHRVRAKPGQPVLLARRGTKLIFGLPGNPGSVLVAFALFVRLAMARLAGEQESPWPTHQQKLATSFHTSNDRPTFHPVRWDGAGVWPLPWGGSADLRSFLPAQGLLILPAGEVRWTAGTMVPLLSLA